MLGLQYYKYLRECPEAAFFQSMSATEIFIESMPEYWSQDYNSSTSIHIIHRLTSQRRSDR